MNCCGRHDVTTNDWKGLASLTSPPDLAYQETLMANVAEIRLAKGDRGIFQDIFLSLESHRPAKSEKDVLDDVAKHFGLPAERAKWPDILC